MSARDRFYEEMQERFGWPDPEKVNRHLAPIDRAIAAGASDDEIADLLVELAGADGADEDGEPES